MIRVLHIVETIGSGGVERRKLLLCKNLDSQIFEHKIICTNAYNDFKNEFLKYNVEVIEVGNFHGPIDFKKHKQVQAVIKNFKPDIIHGAVFEGVTMAAINGFLCRVPKIIVEETSDPQTRGWKANLLMKFFCFISDKIIAVSPATKNYLQNKLKVPNNKCLLVNNGVANPIYLSDLEKNKLRQDLGIKPYEMVLGSVGRMHDDYVKRFSDLIKATAKLVRQGYFVKLLLVGGGRELDRYVELTKEYQIEDKVIFTNYQNDVHPFYEIMDIFLLLSSTESFGLVLAEAMFHRLPIIATNVGGIPFIVEDNCNGFLIKEYSVEDITQKAASLLTDAELRLKMGLIGYQKAKSHYSEKIYTDTVARLYLDLVRKLS